MDGCLVDIDMVELKILPLCPMVEFCDRDASNQFFGTISIDYYIDRFDRRCRIELTSLHNAKELSRCEITWASKIRTAYVERDQEGFNPYSHTARAF